MELVQPPVLQSLFLGSQNDVSILGHSRAVGTVAYSLCVLTGVPGERGGIPAFQSRFLRSRGSPALSAARRGVCSGSSTRQEVLAAG